MSSNKHKQRTHSPQPHATLPGQPVIGQPLGGFQVAVNFDGLTKPDRKFTADACSVLHSQGVFKLVFAQKQLGGDVWQQAIAINASTAGVKRLLLSYNSAQPPFQEMMNKGLDVEIPAVEVQNVQALTLSGNLFHPAMGGGEGCLDIYYAASTDFALAKAKGKLNFEPIVRIQMSAGLLAGLITKLSSVWAEYPAYEKVQA